MFVPLHSFETIKQIAAIKNGWGDAKLREIEVQYRGFLADSVQATTFTPVPSKDVDLLWHEHLLHSATYRADCDAWVGRFVDHRPCLSQDILSKLGIELPRHAGSGPSVDCGASGPAQPGAFDCGAPNQPPDPPGANA